LWGTVVSTVISNWIASVKSTQFVVRPLEKF
jgi:hypothetical protein